ncbi:hypothetical protein QYF36_022105 [Acer negundo]|nr:hypothetical protein QYF36_022105 [Acer negundo]
MRKQRKRGVLLLKLRESVKRCRIKCAMGFCHVFRDTRFIGTNMAVKPTVALRAMLVGGIAVFAKVAGAMKAAGGVKLGAAATAMSMAAAAMTQSKDDPKSPSK